MKTKVSHGVQVVAMSKECTQSAKALANVTAAEENEDNVSAESMKLGYFTATVRTNMNLLQEMYSNLMYHCASSDGMGETFIPHGGPIGSSSGAAAGSGRGRGNRGSDGRVDNEVLK